VSLDAHSGSSKPTGVDLLTILAVMDGIIDIVGAVLLLVVTSLSASWLGLLISPGIVRFISLILVAISFLLLFLGVASLVLAYGLWNGRGWAWKWALASAIMGLAWSTITLGLGIGLVGVATNTLTIYYLTRTDIKDFFGKNHPAKYARNM